MISSPAQVEAYPKIVTDRRELTPEQEKKFKDLLDKHREKVFSKDYKDIGKTELMQMTIETGEHPPIAHKPRPIPLKHQEWVMQEIQKLEDAGLIRRSISHWASPIVVVPKKSAPNEPPRRRMCIDYRALNNCLPTVNKAFSTAKGVLSLIPLPKVDEIYGKLAGCKYFSTLDLRSGYYHIGLTEESIPKTAFVVQFGKWEWLRVPFGLAQAPAYFQDLINQTMAGLPFAQGYLDDILIFSRSFEEHLDHIDQVFQRLAEGNLKLKEEKCEFFRTKVLYLGHVLDEEGIHPIPDKVTKLNEMPPPRTVKEVQQFMGLANYYRKFIPRFSDIARPITELTRKDVDFVWTDERQQSFDMLKSHLSSAPILRYPELDRPFFLYTDASKYAWGAVLTQPHKFEDGLESHLPVHYCSGLLNGPQINWAALTKEAFAIYQAVKKLAIYITGCDVTIRTDHRPLQKFLLKETLNDKVNRWGLELEQFQLKLEYIEGKKNTLADTLSRLVEMNPDVVQPDEVEGEEFGYPVFTRERPIIISAVTRQQSKLIKSQTTVTKNATGASPDPGVLASGSSKCSETTDDEWVAAEHQRQDDSFMELGPWGEITQSIRLDKKKLVELQKVDAECNKVKTALDSRNNSDKQAHKSGTAPKDKDKARLPNFVVKDELLCRRVKDLTGDFLVPVIPVKIQELVARDIHRIGHPGVNKSYEFARRHVYWKDMKNTFQIILATCLPCLERNKHPTLKASPSFYPPKAPMDFICMDLVGDFEVTDNGECVCFDSD